ncbi:MULTISPECIES: recombinase family protein, partial [unclassified Nonomuraea]|uniref:recombinase family protein n=1 Tax=unclassified Nonomuraea TaxID=2593643 RepID=UPI0033E1FBAF
MPQEVSGLEDLPTPSDWARKSSRKPDIERRTVTSDGRFRTRIDDRISDRRIGLQPSSRGEPGADRLLSRLHCDPLPVAAAPHPHRGRPSRAHRRRRRGIPARRRRPPLRGPHHHLQDPALDRPAFGKIAARAHPGDTLTVSELFRLCRDLLDIHAVRNRCQARGVALRVLSGPLSNFHDLAAGDATIAVIINVITAVGQFQRDIQNELTVEG